MRIYIRGYLQRGNEVAIAVICCIAAILLSYVLFHGRLDKLSSQLSSYAEADYSLIYVLNYKVPVENIALFPDTDVMFYTDEEKTQRLTVSSIMKLETEDYSENYLEDLTDLQTDEVILTDTVARKYDLAVGDILYVEYPYTNNLFQKKVVGVAVTDYDFLRPNIDNDIGMVYIGYEKDYENNVRCKYVIFSNKSQAEALAQYSQAISSVLNKSENERYVFGQGLFILIFQAVLVLASFIIANAAFFSKSKKRLKRCYLKGMKKEWIVLWPLFEKVVFAVIPVGLSLYVLMNFVNMNSILARLYFEFPFFIIGIESIVSFLIDMKKYRRS